MHDFCEVKGDPVGKEGGSMNFCQEISSIHLKGRKEELVEEKGDGVNMRFSVWT